MNKELHRPRNDQSYIAFIEANQGTQKESTFKVPRRNAMTKTILAAAVSAALVIPAAAQATFYVVQDTTTKRCTVVKERPTTKTMVVVGDSGKVYTTESEAQAAIRTIKVCESK
jgi:uncharacterized membrane protein